MANMLKENNPILLANIALFILGIVLLLYSFFTAGFGEWNEKNLWRYSGAVLLVLCISPYFFRVLNLGENILVRLNRSLLKPYHAQIGTVAFLLAIFHGLFEGRCNLYIESGMLIYGFLLATGIALWLKLIPPENVKRVYLLHTHHLLVLGLILLIVVGHIIEELG